MTDDTDSSIDGTAAFSRSAGLPMSFGKCTERMSADMPDSLYEAATRRRLSLGMSEAEYVRFCVMRDALGDAEVRRLHERQMDMLFSSGPESGARQP